MAKKPKRETPRDAARRAGYNSVKEMENTQKKQRQQKKERKQRAERAAQEMIEKRKRWLLLCKKELEERLVFQSQMGNRVRAAIRDREAGRRVVDENNINTLRIGQLRTLIKREE